MEFIRTWPIGLIRSATNVVYLSQLIHLRVVPAKQNRPFRQQLGKKAPADDICITD